MARKEELTLKLMKAKAALLDVQVLLESGGRGDAPYRKGVLDPAAEVLEDLLLSPESTYPTQVTDSVRLRLKPLIMSGDVKKSVTNLRADDAFHQPEVLTVINSTVKSLGEVNTT